MWKHCRKLIAQLNYTKDKYKRHSRAICGHSAGGHGSASYSKWPRLQADTHPEESTDSGGNVRGVQVQVTYLLYLIHREEALMRVVWTVEVVQWDLVQHSASYNKWPRWHEDTQRSRSPESSVGTMQEVSCIGFYNN